MAPLRKYFDALLAHYGAPQWWPGDSPFEIMVGAILTQNTAWKNVEKAIRNLKTYELLDARKIHELDQDTLALAIKPAGTYNLKAARLKGFVAWFLERFDGDVERMKQASPDRRREQLREVKGIGPETADAILLYALGMPVFVVDAYTYRVLTRHELALDEATYEDMKEYFERNLPRDAKLFNDFHALIVSVGKDFCRPKARCEQCPLRPYLPPGHGR
ncbi:MAG: endonuclease III domain-containing protein [Planctomycetota bacterium]|nr:MAG: endonuclease III domain-containing protein [Planctomycetota bacterium]